MVRRETGEKVVQRALDYPYRIPGKSFLQVGDETLDLSLRDVAVEGRTPVLALGSNASPEVLDRKFSPELATVPTPVVRARLHDFDIVYSAHISAYGSIPAALQVSPGTEVGTHVLYLTNEQIKVMSETEPNYDLAALRKVRCRLESGEELTSVATYLSKHGCLRVNGSPAALASIEARARRFTPFTEEEVLKYARSRLRPELTMAEFIEENASDLGLAEARTATLAETSEPFGAADWEALNI